LNTGELEGRQTFVQSRIPSHWLIEQMPEAIWATDAALRFVTSGGAAAPALGFEPDRTVGTSIYEHFRTSDPSFPPLAAHLRALHGETGSYEFRHGGRFYVVRVAPIRHVIGRIVGVVACATDVTDVAAAARAESERAALQNLPLAVVRVDGTLRVTFANAVAQQVLGSAVGEGAAFGEALGTPAELVEAARHALNTGETSSLDLSHPGGEDTKFRWHVAAEVHPGEASRAAVVVGTDLTGAASAAEEPDWRRPWDNWSEAAAQLAARPDIAEIAQTLLDQACVLTGVRHGGVRFWATEDDQLLADSTRGLWQGAWGYRLPAGAPPPWGEVAWLDVAGGTEAEQLGIPPGQFRQALVVTVGGNVVRVALSVAWDQDDPQPADNDAAALARLARIAEAVASLHVVLDRARSRQVAMETERRILASWGDSQTLRDGIGRCLISVVDSLGATGAAVYVREGEVWVRTYHTGAREPASTFPTEEGVALAALLAGSPRSVSPTSTDPAFTGEGVEGIHIPLAGEPLQAVLCVESSAERAFSSWEVAALESGARQLAVLLSWQRRAAADAAQGERFRAIVDGYALGVVVLDGGRAIRYANAGAARLIGLQPEEILGRRLAEFVHPDDTAVADEALVRLYAEPQAATMWTLRLQHADGSSRRTEFVGTNRMLDPALGGLVLALQDVSAQREMQDRLLRRVADLEAVQDLATGVGRARSVRDVHMLATAQAAVHLRADHAALALVDPEGDSFTLAHVWGPLAHLSGASFPVTGLYAQVIGSGQPLRADSPHDDLAFPDGSGLGPTLIVPVRGEGAVRGALSVARRVGSTDGPFDDDDLRRMEALAPLAANAISQAELTATLEQAYVDAVLALGRAMDTHDAPGTGHGSVVAHWAEAIARRLGTSDEDVRDIRWAALLHNVGKVGIPEEIVRKTGPLSQGEVALLRQYPVIGAEMLRPAPGLRRAATLVRHHKESWDGTGYPDGLRGEDIPLGSRIIAVADAYNAMTEHRRYKVARPHADAVAELRRGAGIQFDPHVVRAFLDLLSESRAV
jgi:PAS domain S-box-containing protein